MSEVLYAVGFEKALIGHGFQFNNKIAIYDYDKCIDILMEDMTMDEAIEYMDFNVIGAFVGPNTPVFFYKDYELEELDDIWYKVSNE